MTDTTDPREGGSEHAELLRDLDHVAAFPLQGGRVASRAAAAIRALEAKVRGQDEALSHAIWQAESDDQAITRLRADRDRLSEALSVEQRLSKSWQETAEKFRGERDRLAGEVERILVQFDEAIARIKDMLEDDDGQAFKEAGKFLLRIKGRDDES